MKKGRRKKVRYVQVMPKVVQFSPRGRPGRPDEVEFRIEHFEAIKLADYQKYAQIEASKIMGVSRQTFGRILQEARKILADALVNGKIIQMRVGDVQIGVRRKELPAKNCSNMQNFLKEELVREEILNYSIK